MVEEPKLPLFARSRAVIGFLIAAFLSIYRPRLSYQFIRDALSGNARRKLHARIKDMHLPAVLHAYPQPKWGSPLYVVGTPAGLEQLRDLLDAALQDKHSDGAFYTSDGESYQLLVQKTEHPQRLAVPYTESYATEERINAYYPGRDQSP